MITSDRLSVYDPMIKQAVHVPSLGELLTGLGSYEAWRDFKRLALAGTAIPIGLLGLNYLRLYGHKDLLAGAPVQEPPPTSITVEDYYKVLEEEKKELERLKKQIKKSASVVKQADTFQRVMNVFAHYPLLSIAVLGGVPLAANYARKYVFKPLEKKMLIKEIQDTKTEYLKNLRRTSLLSRKLISGSLREDELKNLPEDVRRRAAEKVYNRTGVDISEELGVSLLPSDKEASVKKGIWWIPGHLWSIVRVLPVLPSALFSLGMVESYRQRPFGQSIKATEEQLKEWRARVYPYMVEAHSDLPPPEFFEEPDITEEPTPSPKRLKPKDESIAIANRYVKERLRELEDAEAEIRKVRKTKILSKSD